MLEYLMCGDAWQITKQVADVAPELKELIEQEHNYRARAIQDGLLPTLPNGLQADLQTIFVLYVLPVC